MWVRKPTICGVGPVGGNAHTAQEYLELDSIVPRAQALVLAILRTGRGLVCPGWAMPRRLPIDPAGQARQVSAMRFEILGRKEFKIKHLL